jgi:hypothetical protein
MESIRDIMAVFNFQQLNTPIWHIACKLQETEDPIKKIVAVIDMVVNCLVTFQLLTKAYGEDCMSCAHMFE